MNDRAKPRDPKLDHWWSPPELATLWHMDPKTVRSHLHRLNVEAGHRLFSPKAKHIRILGAVLQDALPGCFASGDEDAGRVTDIRRVVARLDELEAWRDSLDEWRESATTAIRKVTLARTG